MCLNLKFGPQSGVAILEVLFFVLILDTESCLKHVNEMVSDFLLFVGMVVQLPWR